MIRLAIRGVVTRRTQSVVVALGLLVTLIGFVALASQARQTTTTLRGNTENAWHTPYDLLVRPQGSTESLERSDGLIRPNYATGIHGGITLDQLAAIRNAPGVSVAAPLAVVGAVNWPSALQLRLPRTHGADVSVYRVRTASVAQAGLSHYPIETRYIVVAPKGQLSFESAQLAVPGRASPISCRYPVNCFAGTVCFEGSCSPGQYPAADDASYYLPLLQPVQIAGIDPHAEASLAGLSGCVRSGRLLSDHDRLSATEDPEPAEVLPVMASDRAFLDETVDVSISSATASGALRGADVASGDLTWSRATRQHFSMDSLYRKYLASSVHDYLDPWPIWSAGDVRYRQVGPDHLSALPVTPDETIYRRTNTFLEVGLSESLLIPPESADPWLRPVTEHADRQGPGPGSNYRSKIWNVVGQYDPTCLPGFNQLSGGTLDAYESPNVRLPNGRLLGPTRSMSDYVASPPLLLTTLDGARWLADPRRYEGQPGRAFISVVRVRVDGTDNPGAASQRRLAAAAAAIHDRTGLLVDVVKGASTRTVQVDLPAGDFGRPAVTVDEQWSVKGVVLRFATAIRTQDQALLATLLLGAGLLTGQATASAVRQRRKPLAVLRALGWPRYRLACLVELETLVIGVGAGVLALGITLPALVVTHEPVALAFITPAAGIAVAAFAGLPAAWAATRGNVVESMSGTHPARTSRLPATTAGLAMRGLRTSWTSEAVLAGLAIAIGAALVGFVVLVAKGFRSGLDSTILGTTLDTQVRSFHFILVGLTLALGSTAAAQVVVLAWVTRQHEFGVLRALGWSGRRLAAYLCWQAGAIGMIGLVFAVPAIIAVAEITNVPAHALVAAVGGTAAGCLAATAVASVGPVIVAVRASAASLLQDSGHASRRRQRGGS